MEITSTKTNERKKERNALKQAPVQLAHADILLAPEEDGDDEVDGGYKHLKDVVLYSKTWLNSIPKASKIKIFAV